MLKSNLTRTLTVGSVRKAREIALNPPEPPPAPVSARNDSDYRTQDHRLATRLKWAAIAAENAKEQG